MERKQNCSDEMLIRHVLDGRQEAFAVLVERHALGLLHFVGRMMPVQEEAEEVVQDALLAAYQRLHDYDARRAPFVVWLRRIAFNTAMHQLRGHRLTFISIEERLDTTTDETLDRLLSEEGPDLRELLDRALELLRSEERTLLHLFYTDGLPLNEIAFILGLADEGSSARAVSALTSRLHRIRKKLFVTIKLLRNEYQ